MIDLLLETGISNLSISLLLALLAWTVQKSRKHPLIAHLLWVLVLGKLVTPPLLTLPLFEVASAQPYSVAIPDTAKDVLPASLAMESIPTDAEPITKSQADGTGLHSAESLTLRSSKVILVYLWLAGSLGVLLFSSVRVFRFNRLIRAASTEAPQEIQALAESLAQRLQVRSTPCISMTTANLTPMVWWIGGKVRILLPSTILESMDIEQMRWILAHEMAHVRRRDHLVRWLEWLACVCFWWNPVAWWARRNLRANEEICCDALVLSALKPTPHSYATSLLQAVELLASPALRPPAMASEINSGGFLEQRFNMILTNPTHLVAPRRMHSVLLWLAIGLLPLGIANAQAPDYEAVGARLKAAVEAGEITANQANDMLIALKKKAVADHHAVGIRLRDAIAAGELTPEQADAMLETLKGDHSDRMREGIGMALSKKLEAAVEAGEMTKKEADTKFDAIMWRDLLRRPKQKDQNSDWQFRIEDPFASEKNSSIQSRAASETVREWLENRDAIDENKVKYLERVRAFQEAEKRKQEKALSSYRADARAKELERKRRQLEVEYRQDLESAVRGAETDLEAARTRSSRIADQLTLRKELTKALEEKSTNQDELLRELAELRLQVAELENSRVEHSAKRSAQYRRFAEQLRKAEKAGDLSPEDAEKYSLELLMEEQKDAAAAAEARRNAVEYHRKSDELKEQLGKIRLDRNVTEEWLQESRRAQEQYRKRVEEHRERALKDSYNRYKAAAEDMRRLGEIGELKQKDMDQRLQKMRKDLELQRREKGAEQKKDKKQKDSADTIRF